MNVTTTGRKSVKYIKWDGSKKAMVRERYPLGDKKALAKELGISSKAVKHMALKMGVKSERDKHFYSLKPLYDDSVLSYYWMGFVMADGHISKKGQLSISLSSKDRIHLEALSIFLDINLHDYRMRSGFDDTVRDYCRITCQDAFYGRKLMEKFDISGEPKTTNPPASLDISTPKYLLAFLLGFIDGDGSMEMREDGKVASIKLEMHGTWKQVLLDLCARLATLGIGNTAVKVNKRGYAHMRLYKQKNFRYLKRFALHHGLPILKRKWDKIDENNTADWVKATDLPLDCDNFHD